MKLFNGLRLFATVSRLKRPKVKLNPLPVLKTVFDTTLQDSVFGNDLQRPWISFECVAKVLDITIPKPEALLKLKRNNMHSLYEVLAHNRIEIMEKYRFIFKKEILWFCEKNWHTLTRQINYGSKATRIFLFILLECLYSSLKLVDSFLPTVDQDPKKFCLCKVQLDRFLKIRIEICYWGNVEELLNESVNEIVPVKPINERTKFVNEIDPKLLI